MHHHNKEKFDEICELIKNIDSNGDAIAQTLKLRTISEKFRITIKDEKLLGEIFEMLNSRALEDEDFIQSFVTVITSRQLDSFTVNGKILRHAMLTICQKNFQNGDNFKRDDMNKFYNSLKLLGEYFNKARLTNGVPINIIGQSLLNILNVELEKELRNICHLKNDLFAKLILSQIALNGSLLKTRHKTEIEQVLFTIRRCLIELTLSSKTKAFLIMTLDLYYSNFTNVGDALEKMYQTFLIDDVKVGIVRGNSVENGKLSKPVENGKPAKSSPIENGKMTTKTSPEVKVQTSLEKMTITKKPEKNARELRVQIRKTEPVRNNPEPTRNRALSSSSNSRWAPPSPRSNGPLSPQQNHRNPPRSPQKSSPQSRYSYQQSPQQKKLSPQELRTKKSPPSRSGSQTSTRRNRYHQDFDHPPQPRPDSAPLIRPQQHSPPTRHNRTNPNPYGPITPPASAQNGNDDNILRQQNSRSSTPSSSTTATGPSKYKPSTKVYFRAENVENLDWNDDDPEDLDSSASPKANPYSSSFLNFLSSN